MSDASPCARRGSCGLRTSWEWPSLGTHPQVTDVRCKQWGRLISWKGASTFRPVRPPSRSLYENWKLVWTTLRAVSPADQTYGGVSCLRAWSSVLNLCRMAGAFLGVKRPGQWRVPAVSLVSTGLAMSQLPPCHAGTRQDIPTQRLVGCRRPALGELRPAATSAHVPICHSPSETRHLDVAEVSIGLRSMGQTTGAAHGSRSCLVKEVCIDQRTRQEGAIVRCCGSPRRVLCARCRRPPDG